METSKKIILASYTCAVIVTIATFILLFLEKDAMVAGTLCGLVWAEAGTATGFYFRKAECENRLKITGDFARRMRDKIGSDSDLASVMNAVK